VDTTDLCIQGCCAYYSDETDEYCRRGLIQVQTDATFSVWRQLPRISSRPVTHLEISEIWPRIGHGHFQCSARTSYAESVVHFKIKSLTRSDPGIDFVFTLGRLILSRLGALRYVAECLLEPIWFIGQCAPRCAFSRGCGSRRTLAGTLLCGLFCFRPTELWSSVIKQCEKESLLGSLATSATGPCIAADPGGRSGSRPE
jgi:hypothetical protein